MSYENRKWVILTASEAEGVNFGQVCDTSAATLRWNADGSKTFVKYEGSKPSFLSGKTALSHAQMATELENEEWNYDSLA